MGDAVIAPLYEVLLGSLWQPITGEVPLQSATRIATFQGQASIIDHDDAVFRLGVVVSLPFESTFVVQSDDRTDVQTLGRALGELCPDEELMAFAQSLEEKKGPPRGAQQPVG